MNKLGYVLCWLTVLVTLGFAEFFVFLHRNIKLN